MAATIGFRIYSCSSIGFRYLLMSWYVTSTNFLPG